MEAAKKPVFLSSLSCSFDGSDRGPHLLWRWLFQVSGREAVPKAFGFPGGQVYLKRDSKG